MGYCSVMKLFFGFILGLVVGAFLNANSTDEQRRRATQAATNASRRIQETRVGRSVKSNASQVATTAADRITDAVDTAGDAASSAISNNDAPAAT